MSVALSSLRVVTDGDSSGYVKSMADVATANDSATVSMARVGDAQEKVTTTMTRTGVSLAGASSSFERLQRSLDPAYASQVRLGKAQTTLQGALDRGQVSLSRYSELLSMAGAKYGDATAKASPFERSLGAISDQMIALSAGAGPVGVFLAGFGPLGLAAAAGIGLVTGAIDYLVTESNRFGEVASKLHDFSETAGTTATQMQVLQHAGAGVGLATDVVQSSFEKFGVQLSELQKGTGTFYTELQKVSPELTRQMASTRDAAAAWDILSKAYAEADVRQQALIAHAAFGRGGAGSGRLLTATAEAGGIGGLQAKTNPNDIFDDATIQRVGALKTLLDETKSSSANILASIYSEQVLQDQVKFAIKQKEINETLKETSGQFSYWGSFFSNLVAGEGRMAPAPPDPTDLARQRLATGLTSNQLTGSGNTDWTKTGMAGRPVWQPPEQTQGPVDGRVSPLFDLNTSKATVAALGGAATAYEQQAIKVKELNIALADGVLTQTEYNRALAGVKLDTVISLEGQRLSLLGDLAPVSEIVAQKENQITAARMKGTDITKAQAAAISDLTRTQTEGSRLQQQITLGVASEVQIRAQLANEMRGNIEKGLIDPKDATAMANATTALGKSFEKMSESAQLARAPLEGLKKDELDAGNFRLQVDTTAVAGINQMTTSIVDFTTGSKTATVAFQDFAKSLIKMLEEMLVKMLIVLPVAQALQNALGPMVGGVTGGPAPVSNPYAGMGVGSNPTFHSGGMTNEPSGSRYLDPSVFANAPRFHTGIGPDELAAVIKRDEGVFTPGQMRAMGGSGGGSNNVQVNVVNRADNTTTKTSKRRSGGVDVTDVIISTVGSHMANGGFDAQLRARTGTQLQPRGR